MRKTFTAAALLVATVGGIAAGTGAASAQETGAGTGVQGGAERVLPILGDQPVLNDLLGKLPIVGGPGGLALPGLGG